MDRRELCVGRLPSSWQWICVFTDCGPQSFYSDETAPLANWLFLVGRLRPPHHHRSRGCLPARMGLREEFHQEDQRPGPDGHVGRGRFPGPRGGLETSPSGYPSEGGSIICGRQCPGQPREPDIPQARDLKKGTYLCYRIQESGQIPAGSSWREVVFSFDDLGKLSEIIVGNYGVWL